MPFVANPEPGETLHFERKYVEEHGYTFAIAISDRAIYLPVRKFWTLRPSRSACFLRVPLPEVRSLAVGPVRSTGVVLALLVSLIAAAWVLVGLLNGGTCRRCSIGGAVFLMINAGMLLNALPGRRGLRVEHQHGTFRWKQPFGLRADKKRRMRIMLDEIAVAAEDAGIATTWTRAG